jgi:hypothetical protein
MYIWKSHNETHKICNKVKKGGGIRKCNRGGECDQEYTYKEISQ